jgi:hypothetical protein
MIRKQVVGDDGSWLANQHKPLLQSIARFMRVYKAAARAAYHIKGLVWC